jgi:hypothetical protein
VLGVTRCMSHRFGGFGWMSLFRGCPGGCLTVVGVVGWKCPCCDQTISVKLVPFVNFETETIHSKTVKSK